MDITQNLGKLANRDNSQPGDYTHDGILTCGKCHAPKQIMQELPKPGGGTFTRLVTITCQCERKAQDAEEETKRREQFGVRIATMREKFNITDRAYLGLTFERDDRHNAKVSDTCLRYVERWEEVKADNLGVLFYGAVGTGKSFFACAIVNALLRKCVPAVVTNFPRLLNLLQGTHNRQDCIDHLQKYQLLVIDDLGVERDSSYAAEQVFNVIDARARSGLPLIVTTNLTIEELKNPPTMQYARIYDRVLELCPIRIKLAGESRRCRNAAQREARAREILGGA